MIETMKGFQIPLVGMHTQPHHPAILTFSEEQAALIREEIHSLVMKRAVVKAPADYGFFLNLFLPGAQKEWTDVTSH